MNGCFELFVEAQAWVPGIRAWNSCLNRLTLCLSRLTTGADVKRKVIQG
jgi:hypothetical protein